VSGESRSVRGNPNAVSTADEINRERLMRFLPRDESLIWAGTPQLSRLFLRGISRTAFMLLLASVGIYFVIDGITVIDFCGPEPGRMCRKVFVWPWLGLTVAVIYTPFLWLSFLAHASGLLSECYGLTEVQALRLRSNPFDRFQSVKLSQLAKEQIAVQKKFGTVAFGSVTFLCLREADAESLRHVSANGQRAERQPQPALHSHGDAP
jgi:hypothetical protein